MEALGLTEAMLWEAEYASLNLSFNLHHRLIKLFSIPLQWRSPRLVANLMSITIALFSPILPSFVSPTFVPAAIAQTSNCNGIFLEKGARGAAVTALQQDLKLGGYPNIGVDGVFGNQTDDILRRFQASSGLRADGIYGRATCSALTNKVARLNPTTQRAQLLAPPPPPTFRNISVGSRNTNVASNIFASSNTGTGILSGRNLRLNDQGSDVRTLQRALRRIGYDVPVNGVFDEQTRDAVIAFQQSRRITADGIVGPQTEGQLEIVLGDDARSIFEESSRYIVVVPARSESTLMIVSRYVDGARLVDSRRGQFVEAGRSDNRDAAESLSYYLRSYGLDARVFAP
ncbi:peptidoglycan-binding domain-containing protein [[Limnothrix rosea] IAM M-220]|uniref:peptidoglycan-binding domain-containing protein n=1 Tax=[Limnothrix rosea] IAM M-220 TaxID=454133 RepID=UPI000960F2DD|nr:peptidoglycan-binding protein [[Limnothrix rosea] IAM M-220]OKH17851.1 hypothetical protein NIES208_07555 [[Limnothrix rosea] IAM M-220]